MNLKIKLARFSNVARTGTTALSGVFFRAALHTVMDRPFRCYSSFSLSRTQHIYIYLRMFFMCHTHALTHTLTDGTRTPVPLLFVVA